MMVDDVRMAPRAQVRALLISVAALAVPVLGVFVFPDTAAEYEALLWLLALVPAFLFAYQRGWRGVATALALGMATLSVTYAIATAQGLQIPDLLLGVLVAYLAISLGLGWLAESVARDKLGEGAANAALLDALTGLPNRNHAELYLESEFAAAERGRALTIVFFDLDQFSTYNEQNGRGAGDGVLRAFGTLLRANTRRMNLAARWGPEEFLCVLGECDEEGGLVYAGRTQERLRAAGKTAASLPTVSAGVASYRPGVDSATTLITQAETALREAKQAGGDRVRIFGRNLEDLHASEGMAAILSRARMSGDGMTSSEPVMSIDVSQQLGGGRIAYIDMADDAVRSTVQAHLERLGFRCMANVKIGDALHPLNVEYDVVWLDLTTSAAGDLVHSLRRRSPATRIVGVVRQQDGTIPFQALAARADAYWYPGTPSVIAELQMREIMAERDRLVAAAIRTRQLHDEVRARDREAQLALEESEAKYRNVLQALHEIVFRTDREGRLTFLNPAWSTVTGIPVERALGTSLADMLHVDERDAVRAEIAALLKGDSTHVRRTLRLMRGNEERLLEVSVHPLRDRHSALSGISGTLNDVTEQRRAEDALRRSEEHFRALVEEADEIIAVVNLDGRIRYSNRSAPRALGFAPDAPELNSISALNVHPEDEARARNALTHVVSNPDEVVCEEVRVFDADGAWRILEVRAQNRLADPVIHGIVLAARDVGERRRTEAELRESRELLFRAQKMDALGRLAAGIAHDFNNVLTAIRGNAALIMGELPEGVACRRELQEIENAALRAAALTRKLLAFGRGQADEPRAVDVNSAVAELEHMLRRVIGEDVMLVTNLAPALPPVFMDPTQLEQIVLNLVINARDAMPKGGHIVVRTLTADEHVCMLVSDTGIGMEAATRARIFEPFFTTKEENGTGLGLATVYSAVAQAGGNIAVDSEPGRGTTFTVTLPVYWGEAGASGVSGVSGASGASGVSGVSGVSGASGGSGVSGAGASGAAGESGEPGA